MTQAGRALRDDAINLHPPGLKGIRCRDCGRHSFLQRSICPQCGAAAVDGVQLSPRGRVVSWTVVHQAPKPFETPYTLVTVDLEDGVRLLGAATGTVDIGSAVEAEVFELRRCEEENPLWWYRFRSVNR